MTARMVIIERESDGAIFATLPESFAAGAAGVYKGHRIVRWEDGEEWVGPKTAAGVVRAHAAQEAAGGGGKADKSSDEGKDSDSGAASPTADQP